MKIIEGFEKAKKLLDRQAPKDLEYKQEAAVRQIINEVRQHGDKALFELTEKFDGAKLTALEVKPAQIKAAYQKVDAQLVDAMKLAAERIGNISPGTERTRFTYLQSKENRLGGETAGTGGCLCPGRHGQLSLDRVDDGHPGQDSRGK